MASTVTAIMSRIMVKPSERVPETRAMSKRGDLLFRRIRKLDDLMVSLILNFHRGVGDP